MQDRLSTKNNGKLLPIIYFLIVTIIYLGLYFYLEYSLLFKGNWITLLSIILIAYCLLGALVNFIYTLLKKTNLTLKVDSLITTIAFAFTLVSDVYLSEYGNSYEIGLITFILVQITYFIRIEFYSKDTSSVIIKKIIFRILIITILIFVAYFINMFEPLYIKTAIYFSLLCTNFLESLYLSIHSLIKDKKDLAFRIMLAIGFLLFIGCDICVGINNLSGKASSLIWIFYAPSQLLLCVSSFSYIKRGESNENNN